MKTKIKTKNEFQNPDLFLKTKIKIEKWKSKLKIDFYFWKKLLTNRNQCDILIIETNNQTNLRRT